MLSYASPRGHAFIDRALYLPRRWTDDPPRCAQAGVPVERGFRTKPQLVIEMLDRALAAGVPFRYFTADSGYGRDSALRARCHTSAVAYVLAVPVDLPLVAPAGDATRQLSARRASSCRNDRQVDVIPPNTTPRRISATVLAVLGRFAD